MKNPLTLAGIEPATFRFVAQHLNHCATAVPYVVYGRRRIAYDRDGYEKTEDIEEENIKQDIRTSG